MPTDRDPDVPGGSDDPTRANDPVDPTELHDPVDTAHAQGAGPAAGMGGPGRDSAPFSEDPLRRRPEARDDRRTAGWLWALLAAVVIAIVLFALLGGDDDDDAVGTTDETQTTDTAAAETAPPDTVAEDTAVDTTAPPATADEGSDAAPSIPTTAPPDAPAEADATLTTSHGTDLLALIQGDDGDAERLAPHAGSDVRGEAVEVLEVVEGEGFWIGTGDQQRIFAHAGEDVAVEVGQRLTFDGLLEANPPQDSAEVHDIPEDQGAELHRQQGHHIEIASLSAA